MMRRMFQRAGGEQGKVLSECIEDYGLRSGKRGYDQCIVWLLEARAG